MLIILLLVVGGAIVGVLVQPIIDKAETAPATAADLGIRSLSQSTGAVIGGDQQDPYITVQVTYSLDIENTSESEHAVYVCGPSVEILDGPGNPWRLEENICAGYQILKPHTHLIRTIQTGSAIRPFAFTDNASYLASYVRLTGTAYVDRIDRHPIPKTG